MIFDLFHSVSDPVVNGKTLGHRTAVSNFLSQVKLAESLGMDTVWLAESHFSSETQKKTCVATIPNFYGEVGLNADSFQFFHLIQSQTQHINLGTGIHNIVGGSGGPIASADRVNMLRFFNENFWEHPRKLRIGVASGRFPYQNTAFGITARTEPERDFWPIVKRTVFLEALEIFLRLLKGEELSSDQIEPYTIQRANVEKEMAKDLDRLQRKYAFPLKMQKRYEFEAVKLVPECKSERLEIVLGSSDPEALTVARRFWDVDLFNLSFTPPEQIEKLHEKMAGGCVKPWCRTRLPRTVLIFINPVQKKAEEHANSVLDAYIEAMRGTAMVPDKKVLMERALIGDAKAILDQLCPENPRRFHSGDRLMLWFEFNQTNNEAIKQQMQYFHDEVAAKL
jgi:alkanesulfonate monooxygenase SsuD/methylene tetrahydromethanopterin reductase-like flavin-dependent oxidoreductase (luciferase family)